MTLDDARARFPGFGFALYAYEPGGSVTLEIHTGEGEPFVFTAATEAEALELAFPPEPPINPFD